MVILVYQMGSCYTWMMVGGSDSTQLSDLFSRTTKCGSLFLRPHLWSTGAVLVPKQETLSPTLW